MVLPLAGRGSFLTIGSVSSCPPCVRSRVRGFVSGLLVMLAVRFESDGMAGSPCPRCVRVQDGALFPQGAMLFPHKSTFFPYGASTYRGASARTAVAAMAWRKALKLITSQPDIASTSRPE